MNEKQLEEEIKAKGLNAPRLTPKIIDSVIVHDQYHVFAGTTLTVCCLTLLNGFTVTGESACASLDNFNEEIGRKIAYDNAREKIWALEGYLLKHKLNGASANLGDMPDIEATQTFSDEEALEQLNS